ncbi:hypothetical protein HYT23_01595 [Candidatus Pacearchaeota archaeon]|nr:hypothetical protein [Candidatus Pacearchaeota archaeon]
MAPFEFDEGGGYFAPFVIKRIDGRTEDIIGVSLHPDPQRRRDQVRISLASKIGQEVLIFDASKGSHIVGIVQASYQDQDGKYCLRDFSGGFIYSKYDDIVSLSYFERKE